MKKHTLPLYLFGLFLIISVLCACGKSALPPPVQVSYRESFLGGGMVLQIKNASNHHLYNVKVVGRNNSEGSSASVIATKHLRPGAIIEVGWLEFESWIPLSGETMSIYADDYLTPHVSVIP